MEILSNIKHRTNKKLVHLKKKKKKKKVCSDIFRVHLWFVVVDSVIPTPKTAPWPGDVGRRRVPHRSGTEAQGAGAGPR